MRAVLQVLIDQVSKQQTTLDQLIAQVTLLEDSNKKQQKLINLLTCQLYQPNKRIEVKRKQNSRKKSLIRAQKLKGKLCNDIDVLPGKQSKSKCNVTESEVVKSSMESSQPVLSCSEKKNTNSEKSTLNMFGSGAPSAKPIKVKRNVNALSASEINQNPLISIEEVLWKYRKFIVEEKYSALARKLAREAVFGEDTLKRCTPRGLGHLPALPTHSLYVIKQTLLNTFPAFWTKPVEFENVWKKCVIGLQSMCSRIRSISNGSYHKAKSKTTDILKSSSPPTACIIKVKNPLSSSEIVKSSLISIDKFMELHSSGINGQYELGTLVRKLSVEAIFGKEVLIKCTPFGYGGYPGLPVAEFNLLKQTVLNWSPSYWDNLDEFERCWHTIGIKAISTTCSKLRQDQS